MSANLDTLKSELRVGARIMANLPIECGVLWIDDTEAKRIAKTMSDALAAIKAQQAESAQAVRMLNEKEIGLTAVIAFGAEKAKSAAKRSQLDAAWELGPLNLSKIALISADSGFPFVVTGQAPKLEPRAAIAAHQAKALEGVEAVACLVNADVGAMVWPIADINEAGTYCDEGEFPELLYPATTLAALQARIAELEQVVAQSVSDIGQLVEMGAEVARYRRLIEMEVSIVPEEKICYYLRNSSELDELIKNEAIARSAK